jgi:parvulin-like peptidyl-prolyl isomerase
MSMKTGVQRALKEPLVQFLLAGLAVFLVFGLRGNDVDPSSRTIIIGEPQLQRLAASFTQTWQRSPTQEEIDALIRDYIKEEVYYREALRLGLDADDVIIRRRLRSKMEYFAASEVENVRPKDAVLEKMLTKNPAKYAADAEYSFDQIYLGTASADIIAAKGKQIAAELAKLPAGGAAWQQYGDALSVPRSMDNASKTEVARQFGDEFTGALANIAATKKDIWTGPVPSGFGTHWVRVRELRSSKMPALSEVRQAVENDWRAATITNREAKAYQTLLDGYTIKIAQP